MYTAEWARSVSTTLAWFQVKLRDHPNVPIWFGNLFFSELMSLSELRVQKVDVSLCCRLNCREWKSFKRCLTSDVEEYF
jgi:hypothetical protein